MTQSGWDARVMVMKVMMMMIATIKTEEVMVLGHVAFGRP
jgi:hypothetical protein